jgi:hypothetical protein
MRIRWLALAVVLCAAVLAPPAIPAADADNKPAPADARPAKTADEKADELLRQAEESMAQRIYPTARTALEILLKLYPGTPAAARAKQMIEDVPNERGRLLQGFEEQSDVADSGAKWISDEKIVPVGKGAAQIADLRRRHVKFKLDKAEDFVRMRTVSFWVWSAANHRGLSTGTTYFCLYTDDPKDFMAASFQMRGDAEWHLIEINVGRFKERTNTKGRRFTAVGFWNPAGVEVRDFLVDDIRVIEEDPPKSGSMLNAASEGKTVPPLSPPK